MVETPEPERTAKNRRLVFNYLDVSTGNLTEEEFRVVERGRDAGGVIGDPHEYGAWVYVPAGDDEDAPANDASKYPNIAAIVSLARDLGCRWVNFDQDADFLDGFPSFDW